LNGNQYTVMDVQDMLDNRLLNQQISSSVPSSPETVLRNLGAVQAQDYPAALWAIGLRSKSCTKSDVEAAVVERKITRTWLMRGTLHFAASSDIRWMLKLFSPRLVNTATTRDRHLGLSDGVVRKVKSLFRSALRGGRRLSRSEMYRVMERGGVPASNNLGYHMLYRAAWDGLICFGPHAGKEPTFVLAEEWLPKSVPIYHDEAVIEIVDRYFSSHGPATIKDFAWWSGLRVSDAWFGIERASPRLREEVVDGTSYYMPRNPARPAATQRSAYLLPAFDEYLVGYSDRSAILGSKETQKWIREAKVAVVHSNGIFLPTLVVDGEVAGTWKRTNAKAGLVITLLPFRKLSGKEMAEVGEQVDVYAKFLETDATLRV
jgi:DNA glycosylase AlkZ-like